MKLSEMLPSKYIKQGDIDGPTLVTIKKLTTADVSQNQTGDMKWVVVFAELDKPMVLNSTNLKRIAKAHGDDSDDWIGKQMVLYVDEDVEFGGEVVGGLRLRAPKKTTDAKPKPTADDEADMVTARQKAKKAAAATGDPDDDLPDF